MRIVLISDSHTKENIEYILDYLTKKAALWKPDLIFINGDILGENEAREGYGYNFNKTLFLASIDREKILRNIALGYSNLKQLQDYIEKGTPDDSLEVELAGHIRRYVEERYDYLLNLLTRFSAIAKTYFNPGNYESPLHYNVLKELAFLLSVDETYIRKIATLANYRDIFRGFVAKTKSQGMKKITYLGDTTALEGDLLVVGIPGFNPACATGDSMSDFQEKITNDLMNTATRQLSYANKIIVLNQTQGRLRKNPFAFRPASLSVRSFIEKTKGKLREKIFVQSYHHWVTTHFYSASDYKFILNSSAVNRCLFNIIDIGAKLACHEIDPWNDKIRKLSIYNDNLADYETAEKRLSLNYENPEEVIRERNLKGCYYM